MIWKKKGITIVRLNNLILTKVEVQSINDATLTAIASNNFRGDAIRFGSVYVCDDTHDEILETIFSRKTINYDEFILEG